MAPNAFSNGKKNEEGHNLTKVKAQALPIKNSEKKVRGTSPAGGLAVFSARNISKQQCSLYCHSTIRSDVLGATKRCCLNAAPQISNSN